MANSSGPLNNIKKIDIIDIVYMPYKIVSYVKTYYDF